MMDRYAITYPLGKDASLACRREDVGIAVAHAIAHILLLLSLILFRTPRGAWKNYTPFISCWQRPTLVKPANRRVMNTTPTMRARLSQSKIMDSAPPSDRNDWKDAARRLPPYQQQRRRTELIIAPSLLSLICLFLWRETHSAASSMSQSMLRSTYSDEDSAMPSRSSFNENQSITNSTPKSIVSEHKQTNAVNNNTANGTEGGDTGDSVLGRSFSRYPMSNVVLMGQFNFDMGPGLVKTWVNIWSKYFKHIVAAGPFSIATYHELRAAGIQVRRGRDDRGFVSPYENLLETMLDYHRANSKNDSSGMDRIDGVLYVHDDALLNITRLFDGDETVPVNTIISTFESDFGVKRRFQYSIYAEQLRRRWSNGTEESRVSPVFYFEKTPDDDTINRTKHMSLAGLVNQLPKWPHMTACVQQQVHMLSKYDETWWEAFSDYSTGPVLSEKVIDASDDSRGSKLTSEVISRNSYRFSFPAFQQSDFLYMPLNYAKLFEQAARPNVESNIFLECAIPTIVQWVVQAAKKKKSKILDERLPNDPDREVGVVAPKLKEVPLCTDWSLGTRGTDKMLMDCIRVSSDWGMFHPRKLGRMGPDGVKMYELWLDEIQRPRAKATFSLGAALDTQNNTKANTTESPVQS